MKVTVRMHGFGVPSREVTVKTGATYLDLLEALDVPSESVLVFANERPIPVDDPVDAAAGVRIVRIVSGGG